MYGAFVWARRALNRPFRRFPARAVWPSILIPNASSSGRDEIFLSYSCTLGKSQWPAANASGCDAGATSIYGTRGDPTGGQASGDMALISGRHKIVFGQQQGRGIFFGPVFPNGTHDAPAFPCAEGCLYQVIGFPCCYRISLPSTKTILLGWLHQIFDDPTEHVNLKATLPALFEAMRRKLLARGKTSHGRHLSF